MKNQGRIASVCLTLFAPHPTPAEDTAEDALAICEGVLPLAKRGRAFLYKSYLCLTANSAKRLFLTGSEMDAAVDGVNGLNPCLEPRGDPRRRMPKGAMMSGFENQPSAPPAGKGMVGSYVQRIPL